MSKLTQAELDFIANLNDDELVGVVVVFKKDFTDDVMAISDHVPPEINTYFEEVLLPILIKNNLKYLSFGKKNDENKVILLIVFNKNNIGCLDNCDEVVEMQIYCKIETNNQPDSGGCGGCSGNCGDDCDGSGGCGGNCDDCSDDVGDED